MWSRLPFWVEPDTPARSRIFANVTRMSAMNHAARSLTLLTSILFLGVAMLSGGCCGPMWHPGGCASGSCGVGSCGTGSCGSSCGDGCGPCGGCGELYIDPWINDPADCCDPCDSCGNYNGQSCGKCRGVFAGVKSLWGYKCDDGCGCDTGCDGGSCGYGGCDGGACGGDSCGCGSGYPEMHHEYSGGEVYSDGTVMGEETIIENGPIGSGANPRIISQPRVAHQRGASRSIFQPRRVNESKMPLAY